MYVSGIPQVKAAQIDYCKWLASQAKGKGMGIGMKNALDLIPDLVGSYTFAVNEQCFQYGMKPIFQFPLRS